MIELKYTDNKITFREFEYEFEKVEKVSDSMVDIYMGGHIVLFIGGQVSINGTLMNTANDIVDFFNNN